VNPPSIKIRCPRLGGPVPFDYCEGAGEDGAPCFKVLDCWWPYFDVANHLKQRLGEDALAAALRRPPPPKVTGIIEAIQQARRTTDPNTSE
jgi:hypothetical protein